MCDAAGAVIFGPHDVRCRHPTRRTEGDRLFVAKAPAVRMRVASDSALRLENGDGYVRRPDLRPLLYFAGAGQRPLFDPCEGLRGMEGSPRGLNTSFDVRRRDRRGRYAFLCNFMHNRGLAARPGRQRIAGPTAQPGRTIPPARPPQYLTVFRHFRGRAARSIPRPIPPADQVIGMLLMSSSPTRFAPDALFWNV